MKNLKNFSFAFLLFISILGVAQAQALGSCYEAFDNISKLVSDSKAGVLNRLEFKGFEGSVFQENIKFINAVKSNRIEGNYFLRIENKVMKRLNDEILKNKGESYSVSIAFQELFLENLRRLDPQLHSSIHLKYHDYKSLNLGFKEAPNEITLEKAFEKTNREFASSLEKELGERIYKLPEADRSFDEWMMVSLGKTPDEASLAARLSRRNSYDGIIRFSDREGRALELIAVKNQLWRDLQDASISPRLFKSWSDGSKTLNLDIINLARKSSDSKEFIKEAMEVYPSLSEKVGKRIYQYTETIDTFTASVLAPGSVSLSPNSTTGIVYSVDIGQMGAEGFLNTMKAINNVNDLEGLLKASREAFWKADSKLNSFYEHVKKAFGDELEFSLAQSAAHTSGDDALFVFDDALEYLRKRQAALKRSGASKGELQAISKKIELNESKWSRYREEGFDNYFRRVTNHPEAYRLRVTSVKPSYESSGKLVRRADISGYIEIAEGAEKSVRKGLLKEIGPSEARGVFLGIETTPVTKSEIRHRLVVINRSNVPQQKLEEVIHRQYEGYLSGLKDKELSFDQVVLNFL